MFDDYREESRRHVSSVILNEELVGRAPEREKIRYVDVPRVEEIITRVPKREIVEIEKRVPKYEYEWVEKIVEVPVVQTVSKHVEVEQIQEVIRHVPRREVIDVPKEYVRHVPRIETKIVERTVEVPGDIIEVPKPYTIENKVSIPEYNDKEVPFVVAQTFKPVVKEGSEIVEVDSYDYQPQVIPVDIYVPKMHATQLIPYGATETRHRVVQVPAAHYNSMLKLLNGHLMHDDIFSIPYVQENGHRPFLPDTEFLAHVTPLPGIEVDGFQSNQRFHDYHTPAFPTQHKQRGATAKPRGFEQPSPSMYGHGMPELHQDDEDRHSRRQHRHRESRREGGSRSKVSSRRHRDESMKWDVVEDRSLTRSSPSKQAAPKKAKSKRIFC